MANVVSYNDIIEIFEDIAKRHYQINTMFLGRDWELENNADLQYPVLQIYPTVASMPISATTKSYNTINVTMHCKVFDLTQPGEENEKDVHSDTLRTAQDIINEFSSHPYYVRSNISLNKDINLESFEEFEDDISAGWTFDLELRIINQNTFCGLPMDPIPGYSANGPVSTGQIVNVQYLTCDTLPNCPIIQNIEDDIVDLDIRVTALEQGGSGGGNFIPLSGTVPGSDVTGPINFANNLTNILSSINGDDGSYLIATGQNSQLLQYNTATNSQAGLIITGTQYSLASINTGSGIVTLLYNDINGALQYSSSNPNSGGIIGNQDFSLNYDPLSFVQRTYVENNYVPITISTLTGITSTISNLGPRILSSVNDSVNNNSTLIDHRSNRYTLSSNLGNGLSSGMAFLNGGYRVSATDANNNYTNDLRLDTISFDVLGSDNPNNTYYNINGQNTGSIFFETKGSNGTVTISINDNDALVGSADYTSLYSAFSYVQKIYVDNAIASIPAPVTPSLSQVLSTGNTTGANDIIVNSGQLIKSSLNLNNIALNVSGTPDIRIQSARDININGEYINITPSNGGVLNVNGSGVAQRFAISTSLNMDAQLAFSTNSGIYRHYMYVKDTDQTMIFYTVNSDTIFFNGPGPTMVETLRMTYDNNVIVSKLSGTGTRMVVADLNGQLSTQTIPSTAGFVPYTGGTSALDLTGQTITSQSYTTNGTGGLGYMRMLAQSSAPANGVTAGGAITLYSSNIGALAWKRKPNLGSDTFVRTFAGVLTADRVYNLPDAAGTIALTSDLTPYLLSATAATTYEVLANKATDFTTINNTLYPTAQAVSTFVTGQGYITSSALLPYLLSSTAATTYQPLDADLTAIAALSGTSGFLKTNGAGTWTVDNSNYIKNIYKDLTSSTPLTGVTTNTLIKSVLIPANTFAVGDRIVIKTISTKTGTAGTNSVRCYVNTTAAIGGVTVSTTTGAAGNLSLPTERSLIVRNATNNTQAFPAGTSATYDNIGSAALSTLVIDWTVAQYIVFASQNSVVGDSSTMVYVEIQKA